MFKKFNNSIKSNWKTPTYILRMVLDVVVIRGCLLNL